MAVRGIKALNTSARLSNYAVAAVGMPHEVCIQTKAFDECGLHQHEIAFIHKEASKEGKHQLHYVCNEKHSNSS